MATSTNPLIERAQRARAHALQLRDSATITASLIEHNAAVVAVWRSMLGPQLRTGAPRPDTTQQIAELQAEVQHLRTALAGRAVIDQAKGIVMAALHCSEEQAFRALVEQSQRQNRKLREIATELVEVQQRRRPAAPSAAARHERRTPAAG